MKRDARTIMDTLGRRLKLPARLGINSSISAAPSSASDLP